MGMVDPLIEDIDDAAIAGPGRNGRERLGQHRGRGAIDRIMAHQIVGGDAVDPVLAEDCSTVDQQIGRPAEAFGNLRDQFLGRFGIGKVDDETLPLGAVLLQRYRQM